MYISKKTNVAGNIIMKFQHVNDEVDSSCMIFNGLRNCLSFARDQYASGYLFFFCINHLSCIKIDKYQTVEEKSNFKNIYME